MEIDINLLPASLAPIKQIILDLQEELAFYKRKYHLLLEQVQLSRQQRFSPSTEKNLQITFSEDNNQDMTEVNNLPVPDAVKKDHKDRTKQKKVHGRRPLPKELPREIMIHDISDNEKICGCGAYLTRIGEDTSEQLKYTPARLSVIRHVRPKYACKPCQENVKIARPPKCILPKSIATPELVAHVIVSKYADHLPLYRQEAIWKRFNIDISRTNLSGWIQKVALQCQPLVDLMKNNILNGHYVQADETTIQVMNEKTRQNTQKSYMWVFRGGDLACPTVIYDYQETRGGYHAKTFLNGFKGYLQADAYSGYNWAGTLEDTIKVGCMAHARRAFADVAKLSKKAGLAMQALQYFKALYAIEKTAHAQALSYEARYELRRTQAPPLLDKFKKWLENHADKVPHQHKLQQGIQYVLRHWDSLTGYLQDGCIEIDNNLVENAIRPFALGRKNWLFAGSPGGARATAIFFSLVETCKANGVNPFQYFCAIFHRLPACQTSEDFKKLLPQFIQL